MNGALWIATLALIASVFTAGMKVQEKQTIKQQEQYQLCLESGASVEYCEKM